MSAAAFTEESTSRTVMVGDMPVHYHDVGQGDPVVMLHSYGIGTTGWITFHKVLPAFAERYRCIVMDLPNFGRTGPVVYNEPLHNLQARTALGLMDALGIEKGAPGRQLPGRAVRHGPRHEGAPPRRQAGPSAPATSAPAATCTSWATALPRAA